MVSQCERNSGPELGGGKTVMQEDQVRFRDVLLTPVAERDWGHHWTDSYRLDLNSTYDTIQLPRSMTRFRDT